VTNETRFSVAHQPSRRFQRGVLAFSRGTPPDAIYTFKHALVQDAAYDSLLKSRRQALHAKIASVIDQRFPNIKATEPEVLAHHLTVAGLSEAGTRSTGQNHCAGVLVPIDALAAQSIVMHRAQEAKTTGRRTVLVS
jgi:predicted ATPase